MSRLSLRALCSIGLALSLVGTSACNEDECKVNADCGDNQLCNADKECTDRPFVIETVCEDDDSCSSGEICSAGKCEAGCRTNSDCTSSSEYCNLNELECQEIPDQCTSSVDCPQNFNCEQDSADGPLKCVPECSENSDCDDGLTCDDGVCTGCLNNSDCGTGEICRIGLCSAQNIQCDTVGESCDPTLPVSNGFACAKFAGDEEHSCYEECRTGDVCAPSAVPNGDGTFTDEAGFAYFATENCPLGSLCENDSDGVRACRRSDCENPVFGQAACDTLAEANPARFPNGANCNLKTVETVGQVDRGAVFSTLIDDDNAFFCSPAGSLQQGEVGCLQEGGGLGQPAPPRCAAGLTCVADLGLFDLRQDGVEGVCEVPCTNDNQCDLEAGESCVGLDSEREFNTVGICAQRCEPYVSDTEACGDGTKCFAVTSNDGICTDLVGPPGTSEVYGACQNDQSCPNGTVCLNFGGGARCTPQCDPTARNQQAANATCAGGDPRGNVKFLHLASGAPAVDIYVDGTRIVNDAVYGDIGSRDGSWFPLTEGIHAIDVVLGTQRNNRTPLLTTTVNFAGNTSQFVAVVPGDGNTPIAAVVVSDDRLVADPSGSNSRLRATHAVNGVGDVDVVAVADGDDVSIPGNQAELATSIAFGESGSYLNVGEGTYDVYIFPAGAVRLAANSAAIIEDVAVPAGAKGTVFAHGSALGASPVAPAAFVAPYQTFSTIPTTTGYCYDLEQGITGATRPGTGVCFQRCDSYMDYGGTACTESATDDCSIFTDDTSVCFPVGAAALGEGCTDDDQCGKGLFCDEASDGSGICRSYCTVDGFEENTNLAGCTQPNEACFPTADQEGLGECHIPCTPEADGQFSDSSCPAGMKTCYPHDDYNYYCSASGDKAVNTECATDEFSPLTDNTCAAGTLCTRNIAVPDSTFEVTIDSFLSKQGDETSSCRQICRPFLANGQSDCAEGYGCTPILPTQEINTFAGVCTPAVTQIGIGTNPDACPPNEVGRMCGDASFCSVGNTLPVEGSLVCEATAECFELCNPATNLGCSEGKTCEQQGSTDIPSYFIGAFGICRDI